jgi:hypothetical protein
MTETNEGGRLELFGNGEDIKQFLAELKKKHSNITKLSGSYTNNISTGEDGLEVSFTCKTEEGDIEAIYHEETPSCASIEEAEEMRIVKKMTLRVPQAVFDEGKHKDIVDMAKKWLGDMGVDVELVVSKKVEMD